MVKDKEFYERKNMILANIIKVLTEPYDLKEALHTALLEIVNVPWLPLKAKGGIFLKTKGKDQIELLTTTDNFSPELLSLCATIDFGHCLCGRAAQMKEIVFAKCVDERHDVTFDGLSPHGHYNVPFFNSKKELLGVLVLYVEHGHTSTKDEIAFLNTIADALGLICERFIMEEVAQATEKHRLCSMMIATLSHEINNPLTIAMGLAKRLKKFCPDTDMLDKLDDSLSRIANIILEIDSVVEDQEMISERYTESSSVDILKLKKK